MNARETINMTDNELRGKILKWFYERRREGIKVPKPDDFNPPIHSDDLYRICDQLAENNLLDWKPVQSSRSGSLNTVYGRGKISANGVDVVEETRSSPVAINLQNISINQSQGVQIGNQNIQSITTIIENLIMQIDNSNAKEHDKVEAKSRLKEFLKNPLVTSILGKLGDKLLGLLC